MKQSELLAYAIEKLELLDIRYFLVGSLASSTYGEGRLTNDIDIVVDLRASEVEPLCNMFPAPVYYVSLAAAHEAVSQRGQFNVIQPRAGQKIDFMIARADLWGREQVTRRQKEWIFPGVQGYVASPEDVIIGKLIYYQEGEHEKHLRDIASMMRLHAVDIDEDYINRWAKQLELEPVWQAILTRLGRN